MKSAQLFRGLLALLVVLAISVPASAAITLYDKEGTTFSTDGSFNTFYVNSDSEKNAEMEAIAGPDRQQSRVKMGFLPNWIGFNFSRQVGDLKLGGRSSFWVSINDSDTAVTDTLIDVRQFYGTVDAGWGQVLFGKDFTLFNRSNIFLDEILIGYGNVSDTLGLIDGANVSFGNIGSGYTYPTPSAQITYRSPSLAGFRLAVGVIDPSRTAADRDPDGDRIPATAEENAPRFEGELTFSHNFGKASITAWGGFLSQKSESVTGGANVDSQGLSYGVQAKLAGLTLHASGYNGEGIGFLLGTHDAALGLPVVDGVETDGHLLQASYAFGPSKVVASYGKNEHDAGIEDETITGAYFHSINDYLKLAAEYNINTIEIGPAEEETKTIALGAILNF